MIDLCFFVLGIKNIIVQSEQMVIFNTVEELVSKVGDCGFFID